MRGYDRGRPGGSWWCSGLTEGVSPLEPGEFLTAQAPPAVTDEMAATFVIAGTADECRRLEPIRELADSFLLVPPVLDVPLDRLMNYTFALAETFYA